MSQTQIYFLPDLRAGLSAHIQGREGYRAQVQVTLKASATPIKAKPGDPPAIVQKTVNLYGPGDVLGFDARIVRRSDPLPDVYDFEANYFPSIEFTDPDLVIRMRSSIVVLPVYRDGGGHETGHHRYVHHGSIVRDFRARRFVVVDAL